jgi:formate-dependent nitrite reductase membrane component NrfD
MRVFFGTLVILISQLSYDAVMYFYDLSVVLWENLHDILIQIVVVIGILITLSFDAWIFWMLFNWAEHPIAATFVIIGGILVVFFQVGAWINKENINKWFLNEWDRASHTYRRRRKL